MYSIKEFYNNNFCSQQKSVKSATAFLWKYASGIKQMCRPMKFRHPPAVAPLTQLPWWMETSHLWAALSSRASGVRLQISTLSKWDRKSSNFILRMTKRERILWITWSPVKSHIQATVLLNELAAALYSDFKYFRAKFWELIWPL